MRFAGRLFNPEFFIFFMAKPRARGKGFSPKLPSRNVRNTVSRRRETKQGFNRNAIRDRARKLLDFYNAQAKGLLITAEECRFAQNILNKIIENPDFADIYLKKLGDWEEKMYSELDELGIKLGKRSKKFKEVSEEVKRKAGFLVSLKEKFRLSFKLDYAIKHTSERIIHDVSANYLGQSPVVSEVIGSLKRIAREPSPKTIREELKKFEVDDKERMNLSGEELKKANERIKWRANLEQRFKELL